MARSSCDVNAGSRMAGDGESDGLMPSDIERFFDGKRAGVPPSPTRSRPTTLPSMEWYCIGSSDMWYWPRNGSPSANPSHDRWAVDGREPVDGEIDRFEFMMFERQTLHGIVKFDTEQGECHHHLLLSSSTNVLV